VMPSAVIGIILYNEVCSEVCNYGVNGELKLS